ncbi:transglycosylase domain-containing protein [Micromonospora sp. AMSO31t]|uniref:transglycosylase domain-containing protein n=1 Tax=Micromonospora sp. AMSO31t TaxID=2650566 RepID=UPI00124B0F8D|nr:transglycosylase domain-containing protein [Micromonospora sp. AMSO31t]KAB1915873.1 penicillin-binding protein [Micromonospora sp. AMSO31t]
MNYGDPSSSRGRAQIPGPNGEPGLPGSPHGNGWSSGSEGAASARASVTPRGSASGGRASVGGAPPAARGAAGAASVGRAGAGRASVPVSPAPGTSGRTGAGRASVPISPAGPAGRASVGAASVGTAGRASVGSAAVGGRASVARAGVPGFAGGGPGGPGGPTGPGRGGRGGRGEDPARAKKRRRINMMIAGFAVFIMLAGMGVVGFTWYSQKVLLPEDTIPPLSTTIYDRTGKGDPIAKIGDQNRQLVTIEQIPEHVQHAVAAAEDRNFYRHSGVDYKGIARAAWNNVSGGDKQGASTITQQYARNAFDNLNQDTYGRKVKEAILASKLNDKYDKRVIMQHYLNVIYFGRGAYGIQAAAQTYFKKDVSKLTVAEAAVLAALIKQPEPSATHKGYDPAINPQDALDRWNYVVNGMISEKWLDAPNMPQHPTEYPTKTLQKPSKNNGGGFGIDTPYGNVVNYVAQELREMKLCTDNEAEVTEKKPLCAKALSRGGYKITTTIDKKMQEAALDAAQRAKKGSELYGQPKNLMAAMVSIDPANGRVLAYYGGDNGTGTDYAGKNNENGVISGGHSPGSSFKIYTLAAALKEGISVKSRWKGSAFTPKDTKFKVSNAGADKVSCGDSCTLEQSTLKSLNVPFYYITEKIGPDKVLDMAKQAGVTTMWQTDTNPAKPHDLTRADPKDLAPAPFFHVIGYGQYPITVLDHANGVATFANQGVYNKAHFVKLVQKQNPDTGKWDTVGSEKLKGQQRIDKDIVADVTSVLEQYPGQVNRRLDDGRKAAEKTGTWELGDGSTRNGDAWMIGYTPQLATAVWVGNVKDRKAIKDKNGNDVSGARMPGAIFQRFMNEALKGKDKEDFPPAAHVGKDDTGNGKQPPPEVPLPGLPGQPGCDPLGLFCPGGNNGGNNGGGNNGPGLPPGPGDTGGRGGGLLPSTPPTRQTY